MSEATMTFEMVKKNFWPVSAMRAVLMGLVCLLMTWGAGMAEAATVSVDSPADLSKALNKAAPGAVIELAPGDYGELRLSDVKGLANAPIVIRSADPKQPANLSRLDLRKSEYIEFEGLTFDYEFGAFDQPNIRPFQIFTSRNVTFRENVFDGDLAVGLGDSDGYPTGFGLAVSASTQVTLDGNEIRDFYRGLVIFDVVDIKVVNNLVHAIRMDGMNFAQVENVLIEGNTIRDFKRLVDSSDHADMIQFWTNRTERPSRNIVIRDNILNSGKGAYTQSIFMRNDLVDRGLAGAEMFYQNVTIEENVIINAHLHGITLGESDGVKIQRNTVVHNAASDGDNGGPSWWIPQIRVAEKSRDVSVVQNIMPVIVGYTGQRGWDISDNVEIQDSNPTQPGYYDTVFLAARTGDPRNLANFTYVNAEVAARAGARRLLGVKKSELQLMPVISVSPGADDGRFSLSAVRSQLPADATLAEAAFAWQLDGKIVGTEAELDLRLLEVGAHDLGLRVSLPNGQSKDTSLTLHVQGDDILRYGPASGGMLSFAEREPKVLDALPVTHRGIAFGAGTTPWEVPSAEMAGFFEAPAFELFLKLHLPHNKENSGGELLRIHQTLTVTLNGRGGLDIRFNTQDGRVNFVTPPLRRQPGDLVEVLLDYDSARGTLDVLSNNELLSQARITGSIAARNAWGLGFGAHLNNRKPATGEIVELVLSAPQPSTFDIRH